VLYSALAIAILYNVRERKQKKLWNDVGRWGWDENKKDMRMRIYEHP
jgi:hypothetical protein